MCPGGDDNIDTDGDGETCPETETCDDGYVDVCGNCDAACTGPGTGSTCGDGNWCPETEACDDGNTDDGDGCSSTCEADLVIPTVSEWGMAVMTLLVLTTGTLVLRRGLWAQA